MSHSEMWAEQEQDQQAQECEEELYYAILDALQSAKNLGLSKDHLLTLCYTAGIQIDDLS